MMERIIKALEEGIKRELNLRTILLPQKAEGATAAIVLSFSGIEAAGEAADNHEVASMERIHFLATYSTGGTHAAWVNRAIVDSRKLNKLNSDGKMEIVVKIDQEKTKKLYATWSRQQAGSFVYSDDEEKPMPVAYTETYKVTVTYPASMIGG